MEIPGMDFCPIRKKYFPKGKVPPLNGGLNNVGETKPIEQNDPRTKRNFPFLNRLLYLDEPFKVDHSHFLKFRDNHHNFEIRAKNVCQTDSLTVCTDLTTFSVLGGGIQREPMQTMALASTSKWFYASVGNGHLYRGGSVNQLSHSPSSSVSYVFDMAVSGDEHSPSSVFVAGEGLQTWDPACLRPLDKYSHGDEVFLSVVSLDRNIFATTSRQRRLKIWDVRCPLSSRAVGGVTSVSEGALTGISALDSSRFVVRSSCGFVSEIDLRVGSLQAISTNPIFFQSGKKKKLLEECEPVGSGRGRGVVWQVKLPFNDGGGGGKLATFNDIVVVCGQGKVWTMNLRNMDYEFQEFKTNNKIQYQSTFPNFHSDCVSVFGCDEKGTLVTSQISFKD
eukprot:GDKJ01018575.1.p1 GENE.GDKJ01018575.1~~GDKJ01018575.1.p1  ORF type:complete len:392 (-),score=53.30 GDKJ01018575.1:27-1202(-)